MPGHVEVHQDDVRLEVAPPARRPRRPSPPRPTTSTSPARLEERAQAAPERRRGRRRSGRGSARRSRVAPPRSPIAESAAARSTTRAAGLGARSHRGSRRRAPRPARASTPGRSPRAASRRQPTAVVRRPRRVSCPPAVEPDPSTRRAPRAGRRWSSPRPRSGTRPPRPPPAGRAATTGVALDRDRRRGPASVRALEPRRPAGRSRPASPSSSSAGGRRPSTSRRTSASAVADVGAAARRAAAARPRGRVDRALGRRLGAHPDRRQRRPEPVVEVTPQAAPLLLAGQRRAARATAPGRRAAAGRGWQRPPGGQGPWRRSARRAGSRARPPRTPRTRPPDGLGPVDERHGLDRRDRRCPCSATTPARADLVHDLERPTYGRRSASATVSGDGREGAFRVHRPFEPRGRGGASPARARRARRTSAG